jgi:hypothetical protein
MAGDKVTAAGSVHPLPDSSLNYNTLSCDTPPQKIQTLILFLKPVHNKTLSKVINLATRRWVLKIKINDLSSDVDHPPSLRSGTSLLYWADN